MKSLVSPSDALWRSAAALMWPAGHGQFGLWMLSRTVMLLLALALIACARLPAAVERPVSTHLTDVQDAPLAQVARASMQGAGPGESGFRLLPDGEEAWQARLALVQRATRSLDLQYYQVAHDRTGLQLLRALRDAARRGVRVRLLLDDLYAAGQDRLLSALAAQPNTEVRLFNPLPVRDGGFATRIALSLHEFSRINRRMHNKLFIADNSWSISGGRNIADEYFGRGGQANFIDLDVLAAGPTVSEQSAAFDRYWNSVHAWPVQALQPTTDTLTQARDTLGLTETESPSHGSAVAERRFAFEPQHNPLHFATARVLADAPHKVDPAHAGLDGEVAQSHAQLLQTAQHRVTMASPYVVPGAAGLAALKAIASRQIPITLVTNSLATTDEPVVHMGFARYRDALIGMGVRVHELAPSATAPTPGSSTGARPSGSLGRLHAKVSVVDGRKLFIGSMNLDRRSASTNAEAGLIIDSAALAGMASQLLQATGSAAAVGRTEPEAGGASHWLSRLVALLVPEELL